MKIRSGFVTNSSSTSFLIISQDDFDESTFLDLMGVRLDSPIASLFKQLFADIIQSSRRYDLSRVNEDDIGEHLFDGDLTPAMIERLKRAAKQGGKAYLGHLSSDENLIQTFFCTEAFEVESEAIYFNCLSCVW